MQIQLDEVQKPTFFLASREMKLFRGKLQLQVLYVKEG